MITVRLPDKDILLSVGNAICIIPRGEHAEANANLISLSPRMARVLRLIKPLVEFYSEREMNAPANSQEAVRETRDQLHEFRSLLEELEKAGGL